MNLTVLRYGDRMHAWQSKRRSTASSSITIPAAVTGRAERSTSRRCTRKFGRQPTGRFQTATIFIMRTSMRAITRSTIWFASLRRSIMSCIGRNDSRLRVSVTAAGVSTRRGARRETSGSAAQHAGPHGGGRLGWTMLSGSASGAEFYSELTSTSRYGVVQERVPRDIGPTTSPNALRYGVAAVITSLRGARPHVVEQRRERASVR